MKNVCKFQMYNEYALLNENVYLLYYIILLLQQLYEIYRRAINILYFNN